MANTELAKRLHEARIVLESQQALVRSMREDFEATIAADIASLNEAKAVVEAAESALRDAALTAYIASGDKKAVAGAEVKMFTKLDYPEDAAMAWAKESGLCLSLDKKAFEKVAKATPLPFVTEKQDAKVMLASDLSSVAAEG